MLDRNINIYTDNFIKYHHQFYLLIRKYLIINNRIRRCSRRCLRIVYCVSFLLTLLINFQIYQYRSNKYDDRKDRPEYCDQSMIRKYYMYDRSPQQLLTQDPTRPLFTYKLSNENFCSSIDPPHALIFVISKSTNFGIRSAIRRTWGNFGHLTSIKRFSNLRLKLLFLIDINENHLLNINLEQSIYHDLVQVHLPEYYILSTYRDMAILHWTETYCSEVLLTIKTDDDIFLNIFLLGNILNHIIPNITKQQPKIECKYQTNIDPFAVIYGMKILHAQVVRNAYDRALEETRYITTDDEYPCRYYPDYMSGFGYMITRNARLKLLCAFFRHEKSFHMSDVYITGILSEYMNIQRRNLAVKISYSGTDDCDLFFNEYNAYACASSLHYKNKEPSLLTDVYIFERFYVYWKRIYKNRFLYRNRFRY